MQKQSAVYFKNILIDGLLAHIKIQFIPYINHSSTSDVIFPNEWIWTFVPPGGGQFYISWPVEYYVYSFGLLDTQTLKETVKLYVNVSSPFCNITFGEMQTVRKLGHALYEMLEKFNFDQVSAFYDYSYWCYLAVENDMYGSTRYHLSRYLGVPFRLFGYKCCKTNKEQKNVTCYSHIIPWQSSQFFPFFLGVLFFSYFPLVIVKCGHRAIKYGRKLGPPNDRHIGDDDINTDDNDNDDAYIFMKKRGPVTVNRLVLSICGLAKRHPLLATRIRRTAFVLFSPLLIYIFIYIFHVNGKKFGNNARKT